MNFILKALIKKQLKDVPDDQINLILAAMEKNPALFQKIAEEIKASVSAGMNQQDAAMAVMKAHGDELKGLLG